MTDSFLSAKQSYLLSGNLRYRYCPDVHRIAPDLDHLASLIDLIVIGPVFIYNLPIQFAAAPEHLWAGTGILLSLGLCAPYVLRRQHPVPVFLTILIVAVIQVALGIGRSSPTSSSPFPTSPQLGTSLVGADNTSFDASSVSAASAALVVTVSTLWTCLLVAVSVYVLNRVDTRT